MTKRRPLTSNNFDFQTNCFVCNPSNTRGLHVAFFLEEEEQRVVAEYQPLVEHEGAPGIVHGGVLGAILDDAMAWAVNTLTNGFGLTQRAESEFLHPVRTGSTYMLSAQIKDSDSALAIAVAELRDTQGRLCTTMQAQFSLLSRKEAKRIFTQ